MQVTDTGRLVRRRRASRFRDFALHVLDLLCAHQTARSGKVARSTQLTSRSELSVVKSIVIDKWRLDGRSFRCVRVHVHVGLLLLLWHVHTAIVVEVLLLIHAVAVEALVVVTVVKASCQFCQLIVIDASVTQHEATRHVLSVAGRHISVLTQLRWVNAMPTHTTILKVVHVVHVEAVALVWAIEIVEAKKVVGFRLDKRRTRAGHVDLECIVQVFKLLFEGELEGRVVFISGLVGLVGLGFERGELGKGYSG